MEDGLNAYRIVSTPSALDYEVFVKAMLGSRFGICYSLKGSDTILLASQSSSGRVSNAIPGLVFSKRDFHSSVSKQVCLVGYCLERDEDQPDAVRIPLFKDVYSMLFGIDSQIWVISSPAEPEYVKRFKSRLEDSLSRLEVRKTRSEGGRSVSAVLTSSAQTEVYYDSEERKAFLSMLEMLNDSALSNWNAYKTVIFCEDNPEIINYLKSKMLIIEQRPISTGSIEQMFEKAAEIGSVPLSCNKLSEFIFLEESSYREVSVHIGQPVCDGGDICIGSFLKDSVMLTEKSISISSSTLNLGSVLAGLPGGGKTFAAMSIASQARIVAERNTKLVVISPTSEWSRFAAQEGMSLISLYDDTPQINLFGCYAKINIERFYENLAMLLASSSSAGPYRNSMEKCLLSAFHTIYPEDTRPDPVEVYHAIEEAVIAQHGKRTNVGVKYTKHGENVSAALESLRLMLSRPEFAYAEGEDLAALISKGVVFDLSKVSNNMKPFFYSLILNQVYSLADELDEHGGRSLRMLICLEEAQTIFGQDETSGATLDLKQRIQDFRKRGIGIMLLTHNITDIHPSIRRLCQTKLYFRQSPDMAKYAMTDLGFDELESGNAMARLRLLEHRACACSYITEVNGFRRIANPAFMHTKGYDLSTAPQSRAMSFKPANSCVDMRLSVVDGSGSPVSRARVEARYLGEALIGGVTGADGAVVLRKLLPGKRYELIIRDNASEAARKKPVKLSLLASAEAKVPI